jgi:hypothetical protein
MGARETRTSGRALRAQRASECVRLAAAACREGWAALPAWRPGCLEAGASLGCKGAAWGPALKSKSGVTPRVQAFCSLCLLPQRCRVSPTQTIHPSTPPQPSLGRAVLHASLPPSRQLQIGKPPHRIHLSFNWRFCPSTHHHASPANTQPQTDAHSPVAAHSAHAAALARPSAPSDPHQNLPRPATPFPCERRAGQRRGPWIATDALPGRCAG